MSDPQSAGETPAAPPDRPIMVEPDQWTPERMQLEHRFYDIGLSCLLDEIATERQHHAEALGKARLVANAAIRVADERTASAEADLTAARAEIARLTNVLNTGAFDECALKHYGKVALTNLEVRLLNQRAEAAEASLLALQQQMTSLREYVWHRGTCDGNFDNQPCSCGLAAHLTGGPA